MRWPVKQEIPWGALSREVHFAFKPVRIDGQWVWLERYTVTYERGKDWNGVGFWRVKWLHLGVLPQIEPTGAEGAGKPPASTTGDPPGAGAPD